MNTPIRTSTTRVSADGLTQSQRLFRRQIGLTLVEMMVAMAISLLIVLAAVSALIVTRQGFTSVDASPQLRDNARFSADLVQRLGVQAGYQDDVFASKKASAAEIAANIAPSVYGFNNALLSTTAPLTESTERTSDDGSDILILRYQTAETFPGSGTADGSIIDCSGQAPSSVATGKGDSIYSILHVATVGNEPSLMCTYLDSATNAVTTVPIVQGVENFQVLYGTDNVVAETAPTGDTDSVPDQYLRADQLTVDGDPSATNANWRRVRSLRIGMVLRGAPNSLLEKQEPEEPFYPFGKGKNSAAGADGSALSSEDDDPGTVFERDFDGRLRMTSTFTVHLRNDQSLD